MKKDLIKKAGKYFLYALLALVFVSCSDNIEYPRYKLKTIKYVPDSLKAEHRQWVTETIRAASQNMTGGDYEDVDDTIIQAKRTADELFEVGVLGLEKEINDNYWDDITLMYEQMNEKEKQVFKQLKN